MSEEISRLLQEGIAAAQAGDKALAKRKLVQVTELDERNEQAWFWLSGVVEDLEEMKLCLENVITINPTNVRARQGLAWVEEQLFSQPPPPIPFEEPPSIEDQITAAAPIPVPPPLEEPKAPEHRVPCPACGALNFDFASECVKCNFPFAILCSSCNDFVPTDTGLCPNCGAELPLPKKLAGVWEREAQIEDAYRLGLTYLEEGNYQEAKASLEQALVQSPTHVEAIYSLGEACAKLGLTQEAREHWEEVRSLQPGHPYVEQALKSLLSPKERRRLAKEHRKAEREKKRKEEESRRPEGQSLLEAYEKRAQEEPVPEEEMGGFEAFLYTLMVGFVIGVAYALNFGPEPSVEMVPTILKQGGTIAVVVVVFWIVLGIVARLLSRIFKASGQAGGFMVSSSRFLLPFLLLLPPILLSIPQIEAFLPEQFLSPLENNLWLLWAACGGLALFWGLFLLSRGIGRVGRISLWKGLIVGVVSLAIAAGAVGGLAYVGYQQADQLGYLEILGFGEIPETPIPTPTPSPGG